MSARAHPRGSRLLRERVRVLARVLACVLHTDCDRPASRESRRARERVLACLLWIAVLGVACTPPASVDALHAAAATTASTHAVADAPTPAAAHALDTPHPPQSSAPPAAPADLTAPPADAQQTDSGLVTRVLQPGTGERTPRAKDRVRVHFTGWKRSGKLINSTHGGAPATFALDAVIPGWAEGLRLMRVGERRRLWIPDHLSYLRPGRPPSDVVFDIELVQILPGEDRPAPPDVAAAPADATRTQSGLAYKVLHKGAERADRPQPWDRVTLRYSGWSTDGELFESASSARFDLTRVSPGWAEALPLLAVGERARLWVPEPLANPNPGQRGGDLAVNPNPGQRGRHLDPGRRGRHLDPGRRGRPAGTLVFDVELLSIERRAAPPSPPADLARAPKSATRTASGLAYRIVKKGAGTERPSAHARVQVHYSGWTRDGTLFDSSLTRGRPRTVPVDRVIAGWREALQHMVEGDKALLWVPEPLAYAGAPGAPAGPLVYELELLQILN